MNILVPLLLAFLLFYSCHGQEEDEMVVGVINLPSLLRTAIYDANPTLLSVALAEMDQLTTLTTEPNATELQGLKATVTSLYLSLLAAIEDRSSFRNEAIVLLPQMATSTQTYWVDNQQMGTVAGSYGSGSSIGVAGFVNLILSFVVFLLL